jgi:hypothetical protein
MIALNTQILAGHIREPGTIVGRERVLGGGVVYRVRFRDGRVRPFSSAWVCVAVEAPVPRVGLRLVVDNGART